MPRSTASARDPDPCGTPPRRRPQKLADHLQPTSGPRLQPREACAQTLFPSASVRPVNTDPEPSPDFLGGDLTSPVGVRSWTEAVGSLGRSTTAVSESAVPDSRQSSFSARDPLRRQAHVSRCSVAVDEPSGQLRRIRVLCLSRAKSQRSALNPESASCTAHGYRMERAGNSAFGANRSGIARRRFPRGTPSECPEPIWSKRSQQLGRTRQGPLASLSWQAERLGRHCPETPSGRRPRWNCKPSLRIAT